MGTLKSYDVEIIQLAQNSLSEEDFFKIFPFNLKSSNGKITDFIFEAIEEKDPVLVELAILLGFRFGFPSNSAEALCSLIVEPWHYKHEDIARALQKLKSPDTVECLYRASIMRLDYLAYDENSSLAVKCVWALYAIGTDAAIEKLKLLSISNIESIANSSQDRLRNIGIKNG